MIPWWYLLIEGVAFMGLFVAFLLATIQEKKAAFKRERELML